MSKRHVLRPLARRRAATLTGLAVTLALWLVAVPRALATGPAAGWQLEALAQPTSFSAADAVPCVGNVQACDRYVLMVRNVGERASSGKVTITVSLPAGVTTSGQQPPLLEGGNATGWVCSPEGGGFSEVSCETESAVPALTPASAIVLPVSVAEGAPEPLVAHVHLSGGVPECDESGHPLCPTAAASVSTQLDAPALPFEVRKEGFAASLLDAAGAPDTIAGDHPGVQSTSFAFPTVNEIGTTASFQSFPVQDVKQVVIDLPPGLLGDPRSAPACSLTDLSNEGRCAPATKVGTATLIDAKYVDTELTIYNVIPERGYPAEFGIYEPDAKRAILMYGALVGSGAYSHLRLISAPLVRGVINIVGLSTTFFGDPALIDGDQLASAAFLTNPSDCQASGFTTTVHADSWQSPAKTIEPGSEPDFASEPNWREASFTSPPVTGCEALRFHPTLTLAPEAAHRQADEPAGYEAVVEVPQNEQPTGLATPPLKTAMLTLPPGVAISLAAVDGLAGCPETGAEGIDMESNQPGHCPPAATVGKVEVVSPLFEEALKGSLYVAQPECGVGGPACTEAQVERGEVFALYLEASSEAHGVHLKLRGSVEVGGEGREGKHNDLQPGQLRVTFAEMPQDPIGELKLSFHGGPRALLANPQTCGSFTTASELEPWSHRPVPGSEGTPDVTPEPSFAIAGCEERFAPSFTAGMIDPQAGAYGPFSLTFSRADREADLSGVTFTTPPGLLANLASVPLCDEPQAAAGACGQASEVGTATVAAGAGSQPLYLSGHVYLTGPSNGAPFGLSIVVPAVAGVGGIFDFGNVVIRASIAVDAGTAALTIATGGLPQNIDGIPLRLQTVNVTLDRPGFMVNPTSCDPMSIAGAIASAGGAAANVSSRFQAANCASLRFSPKLTALTRANGEFAGHGASLHIVIATAAGQANMRSLKVDLPQRLPARLQTIQDACPESTFDANPAACPQASAIGAAAVQTPILAGMVAGPAYLVSKGGTTSAGAGASAFPDMVLVLQDQGVRIDLTGEVYVSASDITSVTFRALPDVPIRRLDLLLPEGRRSILVASSDLCTKKPLTMATATTAQNGARVKRTVKVAVEGCRRPKRRKNKVQSH